MKKPDDDILKIQKQWLSDLRTRYLSAVRRMAVSEKGSAEYRRNEDEITQIREEVFVVLGIDAENALREEGFIEWAKIRVKGVTLAAVLSLLQPHENVFIMHRISPRELEAVGGGTVEELRAIQCVETCGGHEVERMELTVDDLTEDWTGPDKPVLVITIGETEAKPWVHAKDVGQQSTG